MRRRDFIVAVSGVSFWPIGAAAQQQALPTVGIIFFGAKDMGQGVDAAFRQGLGKEGYRDGQNVEVFYRNTQMYDQLPGLYGDLVRRRVAVIASMGAGNPALPAMAATATVPAVFLIGSARPASGLVTGLDGPASNVTQRFDVLVEMLSAVKSIGYLHNPTVGASEARVRALQAAARARDVRLAIGHANTPVEIEPAFTTLIRQKIGAIIFSTNPLLIARTDQLVALAAQYALPAVYPYREQVASGGLMSFGSSISDAWRLAGTYAGRIIKGESPANFPVPQPSGSQLAINMKTAKALGLTVPTTLLGRADDVIE
jgi:putative tryptophan/tyrosine transport system substrate-binding protein